MKFRSLCLLLLVAVGQSAHIAPFQDPDEDNDVGWNGGDDPMAEEYPEEFRHDNDDSDGEMGDKDGNFPGIFDEDDSSDERPLPFGGSFFDSPFFNLRQVREYFRELEKALARTFRQTLEEAKLLNGTYANTTEEEVVIGGKKFLVQKSIIKGGDNNSAIYIETLTSKAKGNGGMEVRSETKENVTTSR